MAHIEDFSAKDKRTNAKRICLLSFALLLLTLVQMHDAHAVSYNTKIEVIPPVPTTADNISIRISGDWSDSCIPGNPLLTILDHQILIQSSSFGGVCACVITPYSMQVAVGKLPAGQYEVIATNKVGSSPPAELGRKTFSVLYPHKIVPDDFDFDRKSDISVFRPSSGVWYVLPTSLPGTYTSVQWGLSADVPVPGDYDGDGKTDYAVWRPSSGLWYIIPSAAPGTFTATEWGLTTDIPVPADYDGDRKTDYAVWRPASGVWYVLPSSAPGAYTARQWGVSTDRPVPADYDGDGKTDYAVWRPVSGTWCVLPSNSPDIINVTQWGLSSDTPVPANYDGDGKTDYAVWRSASGVWYVIPSTNTSSYTATQWGMAGDLPLSPLTSILASIP